MPSERALRDGGEAGFALIETMRWEKDGGFLRGNLHLERLARSAATLGFMLDADIASEILAKAVADSDADLRVRLELQRDGAMDVTTQNFVPLAPDAVWRIAIADTRLDANDPLLTYKVTRRDAYVAARAEFGIDAIDEVLLLNGDGALCEGTITNLFLRVDQGPLLTPAARNGLLPGILRGQLLAQGDAVEAELTRDDLYAAGDIFVGNSLRGLIRARLTETA